MKTFILTALLCLTLFRPAAGQAPAPSAGEAPRPAAAAAAAPAADYQMVPGDKLRVEVYKDPQLSQSLQVRPDGKITLPLVGDLPAAGRTPTQLRDAVAASLKEYIKDPVVTVIVVETVPEVIYVMGEVNTPGPQPMRGPTSVLQALAVAGGFKDFAHTKDIRILRKSPEGLRTLRFNYNEAIKGSQAPLLLAPGDTVIVP